MKSNQININNQIPIFLNTEINEIYSKTLISEVYISPKISSNLKIIFFTYKNSILKNFKISIGKETFISNEIDENKKILDINNKKDNNNNYIIEYDNNRDYYFMINMGIVEKNTTIEINAVYLSYMQNKGNKYISTLFKRYPMILLYENNEIKEFIKYDKIEGEILLKTQNIIESFNFNTINFNEDIINKEDNQDNNIPNDNNISINVLNKQYNNAKELYIKYQLKGIENIKEYKLYEHLNDFIPLIRLIFITSSLSSRKPQKNNSSNPKLVLFSQKFNEKDDKKINVLHSKQFYNNIKEKNNNISNQINNRNEIDDIKNIYPNKYMFVIDESINMGGEKIAKVRGALKLLLYSLNSNCEYQIIGFDETIKIYDGTFKHAVKSNIIKSLEYLSNIYVSNKKCHLFQIIKLIYYLCNKNKNIPINIFLFTNAICDKKEINKSLNVIYQNSLQKNFHLNIFALGQKYNKYFIVSGSVMGNGNYYLITKLNKLNREVISELSNCYEEYYSNINAVISKSLKKLKTEDISQTNISNNNPLNLYFISNDYDKINIKIYYKKYLKGKYLLHDIIFNNIELYDLIHGDELYLLYLYKNFYDSNIPLNENIINEEIKNENILDKTTSGYFDFLLFLKNFSFNNSINFNNLYDIFYYDNFNNRMAINKNILNINVSYKYNIENYKNTIDETKDYYDLFPISEKKYHDFLLIDEIQDYSENDKKIQKPRKKSYGKMMIGGIFKGVGKVGNSIAVIGKNIGNIGNIGNRISVKKQNQKKEGAKDIKSENIVIQKVQKNEDDLEDDIIDNYTGNKYGYEKKDEFIMNAVFTQDIEGFWNYENKKLISIKEKYKEMNDVVEYTLKENIKNNGLNNIELEKIKNIVMTFNMIITIMKDYKEKNEIFSFIINKGKIFIKNCGFDFNSLMNEIGLIIE